VSVLPDTLFVSHYEELATLAARYFIPIISPWKETVRAGWLMSYGPDISENFRQAGAYAGRILRGEKPADLPVQQATKVELIINMKTAKVLGLTIPESLLLRADEVIE
jgi:putative ABC transport system substrate-binding protein